MDFRKEPSIEHGFACGTVLIFFPNEKSRRATIEASFQMSEKWTASQIQFVENLVRYFFEQILEPKGLESEARSAVLSTLKQAFPEQVTQDLIDGLLNAACADSVLRNKMHEQSHVVLEKFLERFHQLVQDVETSEQMLRDLKETNLN
jgi:hypothetical protein